MRPARPTLRHRIAEVMEPYQGGVALNRVSLFVDLFILICILVSCTLVVVEHYVPAYEGLLWKIEIVFAAIFVVEYLLRWYAAPNRWTYPFGLFAIIDLVAILPTILVLTPDALMLRMVRGVRLLRILRLLRLLRLIRLFRYGHLIRDALVRARIAASAANHQYRLGQIGRLLMWVVVAWVVGANLLHVTEVSLGGESGPYGDYWQSYWHILIVLTSGIEDKEPLSALGRAEVTVVLLAGICVVGLFTGQIVSAVVRRSQWAGKIAMMPPGSTFANHILILGANPHLDELVRELQAALNGRYHILVVSPRAEELEATDPLVYRNVFALAADPGLRRTLAAAGVERTTRVIVLSEPPDQETDPRIRDSRTLMVTLAVLTANDAVPIVAEIESPETVRQAAILHRVEFVVSQSYSARLISNAVLNPGSVEIFNHLMTFGDDTCEFYEITVPPDLVGRTFQEAQKFFLDKDEEPIVLVGLADRARELDTRFLLSPSAAHGTPAPSEIILRAEDRIVVTAYTSPRCAVAEAEDLWTGKILSRR